MDSIKNKLLQNDISKELLEKIDQHLAKLPLPEILITSSNMSKTIIFEGIQKLYEGKINFIHTLSCPDLYVPLETVDTILQLAKFNENIIVLKESSLKIKGSQDSLETLKENNNVITVNRDIDTLVIATNNPENNVIYFSTGYETESPSLAGLVTSAKEKQISNLYLYVCNKLLLPAVKNLLNKSIKVSGYIAPGHLTILTGTDTLNFIPEEYSIPVVIGGFDRVSALFALEKLLYMISNSINKVENTFSSLVNPLGNPLAQQTTYKIFTPGSSYWNGYGLIPFSGLTFQEDYIEFDARKKFKIKLESTPPEGCICQKVLGLKALPQDCLLYSKECTTNTPLGTCMTLETGLCSIFYNTHSLYIPDIKTFSSIVE